MVKPFQDNFSSSNVQAFRYNAAQEELEVIFFSGGWYLYRGVPEDVYEDMKNAGSKGQFVHQHLKDVYPFSILRANRKKPKKKPKKKR